MGSPLFTQCFSISLKSPSSSCSICSSHSPTASVAVRTVRPPPASSSSAEPNHYSAKKQTETAREFKRQAGWPESVKNDLTGHFHRFMASLVEMSNQVRKNIQDSSSLLLFGTTSSILQRPFSAMLPGKGGIPNPQELVLVVGSFRVLTIAKCCLGFKCRYPHPSVSAGTIAGTVYCPGGRNIPGASLLFLFLTLGTPLSNSG